MFFLIALSILILSYSYMGVRLISTIKIGLGWKFALWGILILFLCITPISLMLRFKGLNSLWVDLTAWTAYLSMGFFSFVFIFLVAKDLVSLLFNIFRRAFIAFSRIFKRGSKAVEPPSPERRGFIQQSINLGILGLSGCLTGYGLYEARRLTNVVKVSVPIKDLPAGLEGFRIAQITDIHVSSTIKRDYVQRVVEQTNSLKPDLIALTGDLADGSVWALREDVAPLKALNAPHGVYFVTGNHEYYMGVRSWILEVKRLGLDTLLNEHRIIKADGGNILLGGVTDYRAGRFFQNHASNPAKAISGAPSSNVKILLAHQPRSIYEAEKAGFDLQISGHTHGGQYFPWNYFVGLQQPFVSGLHRYKNIWIYVSRGTGYWGPPIRLCAPSEITLIKFMTL